MSRTKSKAAFEWISSYIPKDPFIAVDKQLRIYFNRDAQGLIGKQRVHIGYDQANQRIVVAPSDIVRPANIKPHNIDKRGYTSARPFLKSTGISTERLPLKYTYLGKDYTDYPKGAYIFGIDGAPGEDG